MTSPSLLLIWFTDISFFGYKVHFWLFPISVSQTRQLCHTTYVVNRGPNNRSRLYLVGEPLVGEHLPRVDHDGEAEHDVPHDLGAIE